MQYSNTCSKCNGVFAVRKEVLLKRIIKFGSLEKLNENYECQKCRSKTTNADLDQLANELKVKLELEKKEREIKKMETLVS